MSKRILLADDESHILNVVSLKLRNAGYEVIVARDGAEALSKARDGRPDMLITDFHMPALNGMDLCLRLRKQEGMYLPAILLTARGNELSQSELLAGGIVEVVSKPFSPRQLLDAVKRHLKPAA